MLEELHQRRCVGGSVLVVAHLCQLRRPQRRFLCCQQRHGTASHNKPAVGMALPGAYRQADRQTDAALICLTCAAATQTCVLQVTAEDPAPHQAHLRIGSLWTREQQGAAGTNLRHSATAGRRWVGVRLCCPSTLPVPKDAPLYVARMHSAGRASGSQAAVAAAKPGFPSAVPMRSSAPSSPTSTSYRGSGSSGSCRQRSAAVGLLYHVQLRGCGLLREPGCGGEDQQHLMWFPSTQIVRFHQLPTSNMWSACMRNMCSATTPVGAAPQRHP